MMKTMKTMCSLGYHHNGFVVNHAYNISIFVVSKYEHI